MGKRMKSNELINFMSVFDIDSKLMSSAVRYKKFFDDEQTDLLNINKYHIFKDVVDTGLIEDIRDYWLNTKIDYSLNSNIIMGSEDYSKNFFGKYTRHFDFYWNQSRHKLTRDLSLTLHAIRNLTLNLNPFYGLIFNNKNLGIYQAITHYPIGEGEMAMHVDPNYFLPVHYNLPLTHAGIDYERGGLHIFHNKMKQSVDEKMEPGDLLLFDGNVPHSIEKISGNGLKSNIGRMQLFAIPTIFNNKKSSFLREVSFEVYGRLRYFLYSKGVGFNSNGRNFR
jgi:hypothetical protein